MNQVWELVEVAVAMLSTMFRRIGLIGTGLDENNLTVTVRYNSQNINLTVPQTCSIRELKTRIIERVGDISEGELSFIIGGSILQDDSSLQEHGIGDQTMLHAFRKKENSTTTHSNSPFVNIRCQYYVYCKDCKGLSPGKLRFNCSTCKEGAFITDRGPDSWYDITEANRISGTCQNQNCDGKMAEFYFKCGCSHNDIYCNPVGLRHIKPNTRQIDCIACGEIQSPVLVYPCPDGHVTCLECFKLYCEVTLNERKFTQNDDYGYTLPCPARCKDSFIQENHHFCLMGEELYNKYKNFGVEEFVLKSGAIFCPGPDCGNAIYPDTFPDKRRLRCADCQHEFCADCRGFIHDGDCNVLLLEPAYQDDPIDEARAERARWERKSLLTINKTTKLCPNKDCKSPTEKDGGCSQMSCSRCGLKWCWICETEWSLTCQGDHWFD